MAKLKDTWRPEYDAYLKAHHFGGLNRRFQVLNRMVRLTGLPRWYIKRQAARRVEACGTPSRSRVGGDDRKTFAPP